MRIRRNLKLLPPKVAREAAKREELTPMHWSVIAGWTTAQKTTYMERTGNLGQGTWRVLQHKRVPDQTRDIYLSVLCGCLRTTEGARP